MRTIWAPIVANLFLFFFFFFFCERDFIKSLSQKNQDDIIEAFNSISRYLGDLLNIDYIYFDQMVDRIYPTELQLNFLDLNLCISNSTRIYDKRDDCDFDIVNFPFPDGDVPGVPHMGYTYLNLFDSPELLQILVTAVIKPLLPNFLRRAIVILNFARRFRNFIAF